MTHKPIPAEMAARAEANRRQRHKLRGLNCAASSERGRLLAWFAGLTTTELKECKVAICNSMDQLRRRRSELARFNREKARRKGRP